MKRKDLERQINQLAKEKGATAQWKEGGNHTKVTIKNVTTTIPRHNDINEITAKSIIKYFREKIK